MRIFNNYLELSYSYIISSKFEFILKGNYLIGRKIIIIPGVNNIFKNLGALKGGSYLIIIKIFNTNLDMQIDYGTRLEEGYQRVTQWLNLDQKKFKFNW
jgi:hypothetical protein